MGFVVENDLRLASKRTREVLSQAVTYCVSHPIPGVSVTAAVKVVIAVMGPDASRELADVYRDRGATFRSEVRDLSERSGTIQGTIVPVGLIQESGTVACVTGALSGTVVGSLVPVA